MPVTKRLPHKLGIVLPSKDLNGRPLPPAIKNKIRNEVHSWFAREIGADTEERQRLRGKYSTKLGVIEERVSEVWAYCTTPVFRTSKRKLTALAEWLCKEANQDAVAILIDGGMEIVEFRKTNKRVPGQKDQ